MADKVVSLKVLVDTSTGQVNVENLNDDLKETVKTTEQAGKQSKETANQMASGFDKMKTSAQQVAPQLSNMVSGIQGMARAALAFIATPLGATLAALTAIGAAFYAAFKTFQPLLDKIEQGFAAVSAAVSTVRNVFVQVITGAKSLGSAITGLGGDMKEAAKSARELKKAQQDLDDIMEQQEVTTAKTRAEINKLNVQAKDRTKTEKERLALLKQAEDLEKQNFAERKKIVDEQLRQAQEAIRINSNLTEKEFERLKKEGLAFKEFAESKGGSQDELFSKLSAALLKQIELEDEATVNLEKNYNKRDKLLDDQRAKAEKAAADRAARAEREKQELEQVKQKTKELIETIYELREESKKDLFDEQTFVKATHQVQTLSMDIAKTVIPIQYSTAETIKNIYLANEEGIKNTMKVASDGIGAIADLIEARGAKNEEAAKKQFERIKKLRIAQALIDTAMGAQSAFADTPGGVIIKSIAAASAVVAGLARVAAIKRTTYGSVDTGAVSANTGSGGAAQSGQSDTFTPIVPQAVRRGRTEPPQKVYVVENEIKEVSGRVDSIKAKAVVQ